MINAVVIKHPESSKFYLFTVPEDHFCVAGDLVMTGHPNKTDCCKFSSLGICVCDSFTLEEGTPNYEKVMCAFNISGEPTGEIVGKYTYESWKDE